MSAAPATKQDRINHQFLTAPFNTWPGEEVLAYFQARKDVHYFAIADGNEVVREKIDAILVNNFEFNGESYQFSAEIDWLTNPSPDVEWAIMLHKFYYAVGLGMAYHGTGDERYVNKWMALTSDWVNNVPVNHLSADVCGRRVQNWIFAHYYFVTVCQAKAVTPDFYRQFLQAIHAQVSYLCENLTPARNHRTLELYTIFMAAVVFPELTDADRWLQFSIDELLTNSLTDILPDGVHCELSTDYHHIVLRNFLAIKRLAVMNGIQLPEQLDRQVNKALMFSVYSHKPDGFIPSLSDGDTGSFVNLLAQGYELYGDETYRYVATAGKLGSAPDRRCKAFNDGGYYLMRSGWGDSGELYQDERYLIFDCGPVGAGNHGHLDLLSFEMAAFGQSLIVDPGRYTYDESGDINWRALFRGTQYHNTLVVDGKNQCRYEFHKTKFKITGEHPHFELKAFASGRNFDFLHGAAFSREYPVVHERKIVFIAGEYWLICDLLTAEETHRYDLLFHLSAMASGEVNLGLAEGCFTVSSPHLLIVQTEDNNTRLSVEDGYISQIYGHKQPAPIVKFSREDSTFCFYTVIYPYKNKKPKVSITPLTVCDQSGQCPLTSANYVEVLIETEQQVKKDRVFIAHQPGEYSANDRVFASPVDVDRLIAGVNHTSIGDNSAGAIDS